MSRKLPLVPTIVVAAAVAVMIGLGVWQLQRAAEKARLLQQYAAAEKLPPIAFPTLPIASDQLPLFHHASGVCLRRVGRRTVPGEHGLEVGQRPGHDAEDLASGGLTFEGFCDGPVPVSREKAWRFV